MNPEAPQETQEPAKAAVAEMPAPPPRALAPVGPVISEPAKAEHDVWDWFGIPLYYRHTPAPATQRAYFWAGFILIVGWLVLNLLHMPYEEGTLMYQLHDMLPIFKWRPYVDYIQGAKYMFHQGYVAGIILSTIVAPMIATASLATERVSGTMEFLRLAPMPTLGIVLGKMFAPGKYLHVVSGIVLAISSVLGLVGGMKFGEVSMTLFCVVLSAITIHALGAFLSSNTIALKGFAPILGWFWIAGMFHAVPVSGNGSHEFIFMSYLSPWGTMITSFWAPRFAVRGDPQFFGSPGMVKVYVLACHALLTFLFLWGATRKLEEKEVAVLPKRGWLALWIFILITAIGVSQNVRGAGGRRNEWDSAAAVILFSTVWLLFLLIQDHPYRRESALAAVCERLAHLKDAASTHVTRRERFPMSHALFAAGLTMATGIAATIFFYLDTRNDQLEDEILYGAPPFILAATAIVFLASIAFEAAAIQFNAFLARNAGAMIGCAILGAAVIAPMIHLSVHHREWSRHVWSARFSLEAANRKPAQRTSPMLDWQSNRYTRGIETMDDALALQRKYQSAAFKFAWDYHPLGVVFYSLCFVGVGGLLIVWRRRAYLGLEREALKALGP